MMQHEFPMPFELVNIKKLKPCPFCGGAAKASFLTTDPDNAFDLGWIGCQNCRCFISYINNSIGLRDAIETWERRADDA